MIKDCPTCQHTKAAQCLSPAYLIMPHIEQKAFWKDNNPPCSLWEPIKFITIDDRTLTK